MNRTMFLALFALFLTAHSALGQTFTWSGLGSDSNWSNPDNWVGNIAPTPGPDVVLQFAFGPANFNMVNDFANPSLNQLVFNDSGYTLSGNSITFVQSTSAALPEVFGAANTAVPTNWVLDDHLTFSGSAATETFVYSGTMTGAGNLNLSGGFTLAAGGAINNSGNIVISTNSGVVTVDGTIGTGGDLSLDNNRVLNGTGTINRNLVMAGAADLTSTGTLTINGDIQIANSPNRLLAGTLQANGLVDVTAGNFIVEAGSTLAGSGNTQISGGAVMSVHGNVAATHNIELAGILLPALLEGTGSIQSDVIVNGDHFVAANGNLTFNGNMVFANSIAQAQLGFASGSFTNNGLITVNGTANVRLEGDVNSTASGSIIVDAGGNLLLTGNQLDANSNLFSQGGTITVGGTTSVGGSVGLDNGVLDLNGNTLNANLAFFSNGSNSLQNSGNLTVGTFGLNVQSGSLSVDSGVVVTGTGALTIDSGASLLNNGLINLDTTVRGTLDGGLGSLINNAVTAEAATLTGALTLQNTLTIQSPGLSQLAAGSNLSIAGLTTIAQGGLTVQTGGFMSALADVNVVGNSLLSVNGDLVTGQLTMDSTTTLQGTGLITADMQIDGMFGPGNSAGTIGVDGTVSLGSTATICIEIGGTTPGILFDRIDGRGTSSLDLGNSTLELMLLNGFTPDAGDEFEFLFDFDSITGTFGNDNGGDGSFSDPRVFFSAGSFAIEYGSQTVRLYDFRAAIPEPQLGMLALVLGLVVYGRRPARQS